LGKNFENEKRETEKAQDCDFAYLSFEAWESIYSLEKPIRDDLIINLLYHLGCTVNELVNIKVDDLDFKHNHIHIRSESSRNKEAREVYISHTLLFKAKEFLATGSNPEYLIFTRQSPQMTTKRVRQIVEKYCSSAGIKDANPQILRYTHIVHAYLKKIPIDAIQKQVGLKRSRAIEIFSQLKLKTSNDVYEAFSK
jgi:integrase/recombinase XerD